MNREILRLAIPNIISNLSIPLLSTVDTALMGRLSDVHIGAVGVGSMIFNFVYWNFGFLRMGTTGITAQYFGAHDLRGMAQTMGRAILIALVLGVLMLILQVPARDAGIFLMHTEGQLSGHVATYFDIRIWAAPATLVSYAMMGWFFGMQNAIYPLIITVSVNALNIIASYIFVFKFGMEISGVAWGTVIAQYFGLLLALVLVMVKYREQLAHLSLRTLAEVNAFRRFLSVNGDIFLRTLCLTFAFGFFYSQSSVLGDELLAVNVILLQYVNWLSYAIDGFAFATESIVGKYFGADKRAEVMKAIRYNFLWAFGFACTFALVYWSLGDLVLKVFTDQPDVIAAASPYLVWMVIIPLAGFACYIWDGVYVGLTASRAMRDTMVLALMVFLGFYYFAGRTWGNHGLWLSLTLFLFVRGVVQFIWFRWRGLQLR